MELMAIYTTVANKDDARRIALSLVEQKLVACAQISEIESFYTWNQAIQQDGEYRILLKTTAEHYARVEAALRKLHPYELPAIYAVPVTQAFAPYAQWVAENSSGK
jgi:periplasmic divalent cation tolerance protein